MNSTLKIYHIKNQGPEKQKTFLHLWHVAKLGQKEAFL